MSNETQPGNPGDSSVSRSDRLRELVAVFLKLGLIGFGGPAAHIGLMEDEFVRRRQWLSREKFIDLLAASNLIPGPNSTEMAIYVGQMRAGFPGLVTAGVCFILPTMALVTAAAWAYTEFGTLPQVGALLYGVKPVIIAVVAQALWSLSRTAVKSPFHLVVGLAALALGAWQVNELVLLLAGGLITLTWVGAAQARKKAEGEKPAAVCLPLMPAWLKQNSLLAAAAGGAATAGTTGFSLGTMFLFFLKVGAVLYGSGYVLLAFLRADLVERWHWLTEAQLLDAVAVGQVTPGPLFTTATFIGYLLGGVPAALLATLGIFLPAFLFVAVSGPLIPRLRESPLAGAFLDGVVVASLALMALVTWHLGRAALCDLPTLILAGLSGLLLVRYRVNSAWLVGAGAIVGLGMSLAGWVR